MATEPKQLETLETLRQKASANGLAGEDALRWLSADEVRTMEPEVSSVGALLSPSTGIVDVHELMLALQGEAEAHGATVALSSPVVDGCVLRGGGGGGSGTATAGGRLRISTADLDLEADEVVNCAGLEATAVAGAIAGVPRASLPTAHVAKGNYFGLAAKSPFSMLVYPVPEAAGLGVHATVDLAGRCRFGPDVEWLADPTAPWDYAVDPSRADSFYAEVRRYWPALPDGALVADYAGARPKLQAPGEPARDFVVQTEAEHGVPGLVNLFGIESPGLTSSMALARLVEAVLSASARGGPSGSGDGRTRTAVAAWLASDDSELNSR